jgi:hypothetical protein
VLDLIRRSYRSGAAKPAALMIEEAEATLEAASNVIANGYLRLDPQEWIGPSGSAERHSAGNPHVSPRFGVRSDEPEQAWGRLRSPTTRTRSARVRHPDWM